LNIQTQGRLSSVGEFEFKLFRLATAKRATVLEFSTWAFVFGITLAVLLIILAALVLWDVLR
jgi:hypothetical protein